MKKPMVNRRGVTLIEMLVVVAIIGILATIATPNFTGIVRNHRLRSSTMTMLSAIRQQRMRAISLNRQIKMTVKVDNTNRTYTYTTTKVPYNFYNPTKLLQGELEAWISESTPEVLESNESFNISAGLKNVTLTPTSSSTGSSSTVDLTFNPSGVIDVPAGTNVVMYLEGWGVITYTLKIYKGGQVSLEGRTR